MNKSNYVLFVLVLCSMSFVKAQVAETREYYPVVKKKSIKQISLIEGEYEISLELTDKETWPVKVYVPEITENQEVPLILALHWAGDRSTYKEYGDCLALPALKPLNAIVIVPSSEDGNWLHPKNEQRVIDLIRKTMKCLPIAKNKVLVTGYSNGGIASWKYAVKYPRLFCVGIPIAGTYDQTSIEIPMYLIHGEEDDLFSLEDVRASIEESTEKGGKIHLQVANGLSHYMACEYVDVLRETALEVKQRHLDR